MAFFQKKKTPEEIAAEAKKAEYARILKESTEIRPPPPPRLAGIPRTVEYRQFLKEVRAKPTTLYERACALAERIVPITPSPSLATKLDEDIKAAYLTVTPHGVLSLTILSMFILLPLAIVAMLLGLGAVFGLFLMGAVLVAGYYIYNYPAMQARVMLMRMSADTVLGILYMVIYMRTSPNIEGALKFAADNLEGPLAWDLKKLLWDIEVGTYTSANAALLVYIEKWKEHNKEFAEALHLLRGTAVEPGRREMLFQETISVILNGTRERAKHYAAGLRMPMMLIDAMGVLLPVMGLVMFPIVIIFMSDAVKPAFVAFGYDILLPLVLWFFTGYVLSTKPPTFSQPDIFRAKGVPPMGRLAIGKVLVPIWPLALLVTIVLLGVAAVGLTSHEVYTAVNFSVLGIMAASLGIATYCGLDAWQKMKVRADIEKIENEFSVALFQLGNLISGGMPIELAVDKAVIALKDLKISELFRTASLNMKKFGYTFEQAMFDKEVGAVWYYPSKLIISIMQTIIETGKKSLAAAGDSMIVASDYLKGMHDVKEDIDEILGETVSSMKFLAMFLAPLVAGVTVTMAVVILQILTQMGAQVAGLMAAGGTGMSTLQLGFLGGFGMAGGAAPISPVGFQLIVGVYMVELAILLAMFMNRIEYGEDVIGERASIGRILVLATIVYAASWLVTYAMFGGALSTLLTPATGG